MRIIHIAFSILLSIPIFACSDVNSNSDQQNEVGSEQESQIIRDIDATEMHQLISENTDATVLDVRTQGELAGGMLPNAKHIDFYSSDFNDQLSKLDKNKPVFVYCAVGGRSGKAMRMMKKMEFKEVYNLKGGFPTWQSAGFEVSK